MKYKFLGIFLIFGIAILAQPKFSEISSYPGAFSRMGFGSRGISMGNSIGAVIDGNLSTYYNPALSAFQENNYLQVGYSFLSLDRSLNYLSFTRNFRFSSKGDKIRAAGVSAGVINAGVSKIDGRDNQGNKTEDLSTSENQFFIALSNRFSDKFAIGLNLKLYYYHLYENVNSTTFGFDLGALYVVNQNLTAAIVLTDINSKYKWDTTELYGQEGNNEENKFPLLKKFAVAYNFHDPKIIASAEIESSNANSTIFRIGVEYCIYTDFYLRGGIDKINLNNNDIPARPSVGFSYNYNFDSWVVGIDYAYTYEPYSVNNVHILSLNFNL